MHKLKLVSTAILSEPVRRYIGLALVVSLGLTGLFSCAKLDDEPIAPSAVGTADSGVEEEGFSPVQRNRPILPASAPAEEATFIDPTVIITNARAISLGKQIYIGPFASLIASDYHNDDRSAGTPVTPVGLRGNDEEDIKIRIGKETNLQDNVTVIAEAEHSSAEHAKIALLGIEGVEIGERVILAHGSTVKGPAQIGIQGTDIPSDPDDDQEVFLSFGCEIDGAILETNTGVSALARVGPGVRLRSGFIVLPGKNVTTQAEADDPALGKVRLIVEADVLFNEGVLEVNIALAREYTRLARERASNVYGINVDPGNTPFNPTRDVPEIGGRAIRLPVFHNRIIGEVKLENTLPELIRVIGYRNSIRADEGDPFTIGRIARMENNVIFHALEETPIQAGDNIRYGERAIVHGGGRRPLLGGGDNEPTILEDNVQLKSQAVVFRSLIGRGSIIGRKSAVVNTDVAPNTVIPDRVIYVNNALFGPVEW
ncbi:hypothetical protein [uncultured Hymenobacter sp.]|uniref:hypothetical protein n=1 Tax=uncultured Hymenobacter sp. TaxID=170016 RepID=UPI0035CAD141